MRASGPHGANRAGLGVGGRLRPEDFAHHGDVWPFSRQTPGASNPTKEKLRVTSQEHGHTGTQARTCWVPGGSGWWCNSRSGNRRSEDKDSEGQVLIWVHKGERMAITRAFRNSAELEGPLRKEHEGQPARRLICTPPYQLGPHHARPPGPAAQAAPRDQEALGPSLPRNAHKGQIARGPEG